MAQRITVLMAGLLFLVESEASDVAGNYNKFLTPSINRVNQATTPTIADREEKHTAQKLLTNDSSSPITLSAIGIGLLSLATMLGVRLWRGLQPATVLASSGGLGDNLMEMKPAVFALNPLKARRSVAKYSDKAVPASATQKALEAAIQAPNHFLSEPWRFYTAGPETKAKLCGLNEDKRAAAEGVPEWLIVTCASEHDLSEKLGLEDHAAVACAIQNFMLSLAEDGIGSKWMTGALGAAPEDVLACVNAPAGEKLMGAIWYGYPAKDLAEDAKAPPRKKGLDGVLTACP